MDPNGHTPFKWAYGHDPNRRAGCALVGLIAPGSVSVGVGAGSIIVDAAARAPALLTEAAGSKGIVDGAELGDSYFDFGEFPLCGNSLQITDNR